MKLSIAIPTLNRAELLSFTIEHFVLQISKYLNDVELVICNNASDDDTSKVVDHFKDKFSFIKFFDCSDRVSLGDSFKRTVSYSTGDYVILWGDDDIPAPFLIEYLLELINNNLHIQLIYFNRLVGYEDGCKFKSLSIYNNTYSGVYKIYQSSTQFILEHFWGATFMSAVLFSRKIWEDGLKFDTSTHYGFEFMGILYYGNGNRPIMYEQYPVCIQRKVANRAWATDWPKYALLGLPNLSRDLETEGLFYNGFKIWQTKYNKFVLFCYILMSAATDKKKYKPMCKEIAYNQKGYVRKALVYLIVNYMPSFVYNLSRKILFRLKK